MSRDLNPFKNMGGGGVIAATDAVDPAEWLGQVRLAEARAVGELEVRPLCFTGNPGRAYVLLHEALGTGSLEVREQGGGVVAEVVARNKGAEPVLILEGESIVGAKQNRVVASTVLVGAGESVTIPVGCVEHGRWSARGGSFDAAPLPVEPSIRKKTVQEVASYGRLDQGRLWTDVAMKLSMREAHSSTSDYHQATEQHRRDAEERSRAFATVPEQVGFIALWRGGLLGLEVLGHPRNWSTHARRLMPSYLLAADAAAHDARWRPGAARRTAEGWLIEVARAGLRTGQARGLGIPFALAGPGFSGAGLWHEGRPAHLAVFSN